MSYRADKLVIDTRTDTHTHRQTQATTIPVGQYWPRVKMIRQLEQILWMNIILRWVSHWFHIMQYPLVTLLCQLFQKTGPLLPKQVGTRERAVTSNDHQVGDAPIDEVEGSLQPACSLTEILAASTANWRATLKEGKGQPSTNFTMFFIL